MSNEKGLTLDEGRVRFIEKLGQYYEGYGVPRIGGRILGLLIASEEPVCAEDMATLLHVSRASVSTNLRLLLAYGLAEKALGRGERTDYYTVATDAWRNAIRVRVEGFKALKAIARQGLDAVGGDGNSRWKMEEMEHWAEAMTQGHEEMLKEWAKR